MTDWLFRWALVLIALCAVGFGEWRVHAQEEAFAAVLKSKEDGWKRARKMDHQWICTEDRQ